MSKRKPSPCPFCAGQAKQKQSEFLSGRTTVQIICTKCGCTTPQIEANIEFAAIDKAIEIWNTRVNKEDLIQQE